MKIIIDPFDNTESIDVGFNDLDGDRVEVTRCEGFGGCDIQITAGILTWAELDELKKAIAMAEERWRS